MRLAFFAAAAAVATATLCAPSVWAQEDTAAAEALFRDAKRLLDEKDYANACPKFAESFRIDPATGTLLALAICHEGQGKLASAWAEYSDVASRARREQRPDREEAARERVQALGPLLSTLTVSVVPELRGLPNLQVTRNGVPLREASWGSAIPVDPGDYVIQATADGKRPNEQRVSVGGNADKKIVLVPPLADAPTQAADPQAPIASTTAPAAADHATSDDSTKDTLRLAGIITGGVGIVTLGIGSVFGLQAQSKLDESNEKGCEGNFCRGEGTTLRNDARSAGNLATILFVAGGVLTAGGVTMFVLGLPSSESQTVAKAPRRFVRAEPIVASDTLGVSVSGGF